MPKRNGKKPVMSQIRAPRATLQLDKERHIVMDWNTLTLFEEATGQDVLAKDGNLNIVGARNIRALLWASLAQEDPDLTLQDAGKLIKGGNLVDILDALKQSLRESDLFTMTEGADSPKVEAPIGTG
jgi:hypothetical protein